MHCRKGHHGRSTIFIEAQPEPTSERTGLQMKYFVLKPRGNDKYARASRAALIAYAVVIQSENPELSEELLEWEQQESERAARGEV